MICTAVAKLVPEHAAASEDSPAPKVLVTLDVPGKVADFLRTAELEPAERAALDQGVTVRRSQGCTLRVTAVPPCTIDSSPAANRSTAARASPRARREYENRVSAFSQ
ncbi:resolvase [Streptomyces sp. NPDC017979]|uniref:resolvase n=1 Tax=Streptomyces sp. NPDC017979 TaxID=3365024 RepID=UPI00378F6F45